MAMRRGRSRIVPRRLTTNPAGTAPSARITNSDPIGFPQEGLSRHRRPNAAQGATDRARPSLPSVNFFFIISMGRSSRPPLWVLWRVYFNRACEGRSIPAGKGRAHGGRGREFEVRYSQGRPDVGRTIQSARQNVVESRFYRSPLSGDRSTGWIILLRRTSPCHIQPLPLGIMAHAPAIQTAVFARERRLSAPFGAQALSARPRPSSDSQRRAALRQAQDERRKARKATVRSFNSIIVLGPESPFPLHPFAFTE